MTEGFVEVYAKSTGNKQLVPEHWLDHPVLGRNFSKTPSSVAREQADAGPSPEDGLTESSIAEPPSASWTRERLDRHASGLGLDTTTLPNKGEVLAAIEDAALSTDTSPEVDAQGADTQNSDGTPPADQTPAAGENQE